MHTTTSWSLTARSVLHTSKQVLDTCVKQSGAPEGFVHQIVNATLWILYRSRVAVSGRRAAHICSLEWCTRRNNATASREVPPTQSGEWTTGCNCKAKHYVLDLDVYERHASLPVLGKYKTGFIVRSLEMIGAFRLILPSNRVTHRLGCPPSVWQWMELFKCDSSGWRRRQCAGDRETETVRLIPGLFVCACVQSN